jgi:WD40 repeat protein
MDSTRRARRPILGTLIGGALVLAASGCGTATLSTFSGDGQSATAQPEASAPASATPLGWTATGSMIEPRGGHAAVLADGRVLVAGGFEATGFLVGTAELYDPETGSWTASASLSEARAGHTVTALPDDTVLVIGGFSDTGMKGTAELYDPATGTWSATERDVVSPRTEHSATLMPDGTVLIVGGFTGMGGDFNETTRSVEIFDPTTASATPTGETLEGRAGQTATLLLDGRVLIAGGSVGGGVGDVREPLVSSELYDPETGAWTAVEMVDDRFGHTATLLPDGRVLVAGGFGHGIGALSSTEIFDPLSETWTTTASLAEVRSSHGAVLLPNGSVLVAGGDDGTGPDGSLASSELYDPAAGSWTPGGEMVIAGGSSALMLPDGIVLLLNAFGSPQLYEPESDD